MTVTLIAHPRHRVAKGQASARAVEHVVEDRVFAPLMVVGTTTPMAAL
ncbi:hypothetical protein [Kineococcus esterisolvens]